MTLFLFVLYINFTLLHLSMLKFLCAHPKSASIRTMLFFSLYIISNRLCFLRSCKVVHSSCSIMLLTDEVLWYRLETYRAALLWTISNRVMYSPSPKSEVHLSTITHYMDISSNMIHQQNTWDVPFHQTSNGVNI
jgi:hypothetical protein